MYAMAVTRYEVWVVHVVVAIFVIPTLVLSLLLAYATTIVQVLLVDNTAVISIPSAFASPKLISLSGYIFLLWYLYLVVKGIGYVIKGMFNSDVLWKAYPRVMRVLFRWKDFIGYCLLVYPGMEPTYVRRSECWALRFQIMYVLSGLVVVPLDMYILRYGVGEVMTPFLTSVYVLSIFLWALPAVFCTEKRVWVRTLRGRGKVIDKWCALQQRIHTYFTAEV